MKGWKSDRFGHRKCVGVELTLNYEVMTIHHVTRSLSKGDNRGKGTPQHYPCYSTTCSINSADSLTVFMPKLWVVDRLNVARVQHL